MRVHIGTIHFKEEMKEKEESIADIVNTPPKVQNSEGDTSVTLTQSALKDSEMFEK